MPSSTKIAIVAALEREVWPLVKDWSASRREYGGRWFKAVWGLLDQNPLAILSFPDQRADAIFHVGVAALFAVPMLVDAIRGAIKPP